MWRILAPLNYLRIDHPEKRKFDITLPLMLAVFFVLPLLSQEFRSDAVEGDFNVIGNVTNFLGTMVGFFIAALAAVATFGKSEMDAPMPGEPRVRLEHRRNAETYFEDLSRRRFLSFLFGYLSLLALLLYMLGQAYVIIDRYFVAAYFLDYRRAIFSGFWVVYSLGLANIISNTLLGLYYLTDRIHRPNPNLRREPASLMGGSSTPSEDP